MTPDYPSEIVGMFHREKGNFAVQIEYRTIEMRCKVLTFICASSDSSYLIR